MQFLLLLSALLSAVTGAFAGPRVEVRADQAQAQQIAGAEDAARAEAAAPRIPKACTPRIVPKPAPAAASAVVARKAPLDTDCLHE